MNPVMWPVIGPGPPLFRTQMPSPMALPPSKDPPCCSPWRYGPQASSSPSASSCMKKMYSAMPISHGLTLPEPQPRALLRLLRLDCAVARRRMRMQRGQKATGGFRDFLDGKLERGFVGLRGLVEAGKLAHELQRRSMDLILARRRVEIKQRLDVAAHRLSPLPGTAPNTFSQGRSGKANCYITAHFCHRISGPFIRAMRRVPFNVPRHLQDRPARRRLGLYRQWRILRTVCDPCRGTCRRKARCWRTAGARPHRVDRV